MLSKSHSACKSLWLGLMAHARAVHEQVQEVGDGNINFVYIVEGPKGGLVVKQGLPYIRIAPDWPLTQVQPSCSTHLSVRSSRRGWR